MQSETPKRITLSRAKGWRMPPNTVKVDRSTKWGNPFVAKLFGKSLLDDSPVWRCAHDWELDYPTFRTMSEAAQCAVQRFRDWIECRDGQTAARRRRAILENISELRGKNLACWCKPGEPCHADVLLEIANAGGNADE